MGELINGRTAEVIKSNLSYLVRCETCPQNHEYGCDFDGRTKECRTVIDALDLIDHLEARIAELEAKQPKWISVEERLPEEKESVFVHYVDGWMTIAFLLDGKWYQSGRGTSWLSVTHWMPLPEPPEEGEV